MEEIGEQYINISFSNLDNFFNSAYGVNVKAIVFGAMQLISDRDITITFLKHHLEDFMPSGPKCSCAPDEKLLQHRCLPISVCNTWIFPGNVLQCPLIDYTLAEIIKLHIDIKNGTFEEDIVTIPAFHRDEVIRIFHDGHTIPPAHLAFMDYPMDCELPLIIIDNSENTTLEP
jgi:hypothetical protein